MIALKAYAIMGVAGLSVVGSAYLIGRSHASEACERRNAKAAEDAATAKNNAEAAQEAVTGPINKELSHEVSRLQKLLARRSQPLSSPGVSCGSAGDSDGVLDDYNEIFEPVLPTASDGDDA